MVWCYLPTRKHCTVLVLVLMDDLNDISFLFNVWICYSTLE